MNAYDIILKPVLSEKSYAGISKKVYTFAVNKNANKIQVKSAIEEIFAVKVQKVNIANVRGKLKRQGRTAGKTASWKKATIHLTADSKAIEFFESLS